jgi:hypothetical protein
MTTGEPDVRFEPAISAVELDPAIRALRVAWDRAAGPMNARWSKRAAPRIQTCQEVVNRLAEYHAQIVDRTDVDLSAPTRWVAILESTARCISLADALIDQLRQGYASETAGTARILHEALDLAVALAAGDEAQAKSWLRGRQYPVKLAQHERTAFFARLIDDAEASVALDSAVAAHVAAAQEEMGVRLTDAVDAIHKISGRSYGMLSESAHNRRGGFADAIAVDLRRFSYGRHPDPGIRSHWIERGENLIEQACLDVPAALAEIVGVDAVREAALQLVNTINLARTRYPLS